MQHYIFTNLLGTFIFDENFKLIDKILFQNIEQYKIKDAAEEKLKLRYNATSPELKQLRNILSYYTIIFLML